MYECDVLSEHVQGIHAKPNFFLMRRTRPPILSNSTDTEMKLVHVAAFVIFLFSLI